MLPSYKEGKHKVLFHRLSGDLDVNSITFSAPSPDCKAFIFAVTGFNEGRVGEVMNVGEGYHRFEFARRGVSVYCIPGKTFL